LTSDRIGHLVRITGQVKIFQNLFSLVCDRPRSISLNYFGVNLLLLCTKLDHSIEQAILLHWYEVI
jgi:hypothetical protein